MFRDPLVDRSDRNTLISFRGSFLRSTSNNGRIRSSGTHGDTPNTVSSDREPSGEHFYMISQGSPWSHLKCDQTHSRDSSEIPREPRWRRCFLILPRHFGP